MPALKPLTLYYDPGRSKWYFYSKEQIMTLPETVYWGASPSLIKISAKIDLQAPTEALPMNAMLGSGKRPVLGPLIGILSAENQDGSLKGNISNYKAIIKAGQKIGGIVFAFSPGSVIWEKSIINGKIFDQYNNKWAASIFPFPNVVYNRIQDRNHEKNENSQLCIKRFLSHPGITLYNPGFFNKEEVIRALNSSQKIKNHIPETIVLLSKIDLIYMLKRHKALYLKPTDNKLGSGIIRIVKPRLEKPYTMHYYAHDKKLKKYRTYKIDLLWHRIRQQMVPSAYIVQQAIPLAVISSCPFDCRVLLQKNKNGLWQISGIGIRIAAHSQSITTHVPRGGRIGLPKDVWQQALPQHNPVLLFQRVCRLCIAAAKKLDRHYKLLGEMSIDVGLDRGGHPWIFEANAKPMKFDEPEIRKKQLEQVIRYAQFLTYS